jgi:hypothetical protein
MATATVVGPGVVRHDARTVGDPKAGRTPRPEEPTISDYVSQDVPGTVGAAEFRLPRIWTTLSAAAALLSAVGAVVGLLAPDTVYGDETTVLQDAATAQDLVGLVVVAPLLVALAWAGSRGSVRSWLCLLGCLSFTAYNYAIYAFSVHFGPLFLVWVAVLGLSLFALIGGLAGLSPGVLDERFGRASVRPPGWFLVAVGALFVLLWLREIVPDLVAGRPSTSAADWRVPTNPVHVLDLAFFLPSVVLSGVLLLRRHWFGYATAAGQLVFLGLTCLPVLVTPLVAEARGHAAAWSVVGPIGLVAVATALVLWRFLRPVRVAATADQPGSSSVRTRGTPGR